MFFYCHKCKYDGFSNILKGRLSTIAGFNLSKKSRVKPKKLKPKVKKHAVNRRVVKIVAFSILGFLIISGPLAVSRTTRISNENRYIKKKYSDLKAELDKAQTGSDGYNPALGRYMNRFVTAYITMTGQTADLKNWQDGLKPYLATNLDASKLIESNDLKAQKLTNLAIVAMYVKNNVKIAQLKVDYQIQMDGGDNWASKSIYLNVPYAVRNNKFTVVADPFVTQELNTTGHVAKAATRNDKDLPLNDTGVVDDVTNFSNKFFDKYASSNTDEMSFIMADPVALGGEYTVKDVNVARVTGSKNKPEVSGSVTFTQKDTNVSHTEQFDLKLTKQKGTYFVLDFTH